MCRLSKKSATKWGPAVCTGFHRENGITRKSISPPPFCPHYLAKNPWEFSRPMRGFVLYRYEPDWSKLIQFRILVAYSKKNIWKTHVLHLLEQRLSRTLLLWFPMVLEDLRKFPETYRIHFHLAGYFSKFRVPSYKQTTFGMVCLRERHKCCLVATYTI